MKHSPVNIILKVNRKCNFGCEYCHDIDDVDMVEQDRIMPFDVLACSIERVLSGKKATSIRFIWHGGEPLLRGSDFFLKVAALQSEFMQPGQEISNSVQTNGYLLNEKFMDFFKSAGFSVGVSLDGPEYIHDAQRPTRQSKPTYKRVIESIHRLYSYEIPFGVITVLTSRSLAVPPLEFLNFYRDNNISSVCFLPVRSDCQQHGETLDGNQFANFMERMFDAWLSIDDPGFQIREFKDWIALSLGLKGTLCSSAGSCIGGSYSIEPDGKVFHCDKFVQDKDFFYGNIEDIDFDQLSSSKQFHNLCSWDNKLPKLCLGCDWIMTCAGGCGHDRYLKLKNGDNEETCHLQELLIHIRSRIKNHPKAQEIIEGSQKETALTQ